MCTQAKLPVTFPKVANEQRMTPEQYPGVPAGSYSYQAKYSEGQINGYRWYDKHPDVKPAFPFGHGLVSSAFRRTNCGLDRCAAMDEC